MNFKTIFTFFLGIVIVITGLLSYDFYKTITSPLSSEPSQVVIEVKKGGGLNNISSLLHQKGLIKDPQTFKLLALIKGVVFNLKAGEYRLSPAMTQVEILNKITRGLVIQHSITIPEGYNIYEIADLLQKNNITKKDTFIASVFDPKIINELGFNTNSLEGYLFPETYFFEKNVSDYHILKKMVATFKKKIMTHEIMAAVKESKLSFHKIVILASVIEKETGKEEERPLVSAVFHNRLRKKMLLQSDPTVIYSIRNFDGNLRKKDLQIDSPYNTYRYAGLPPGPIANPGLSSIKTALHPAKVDYLYFVSKKNGEHKFSSTLKEHNRAVLKYQKRRRP